MPKAYAVVTYRSISDPQKLAAYGKLALPAVEPFGARILARSNAAVARVHGLVRRVGSAPQGVLGTFPNLPCLGAKPSHSLGTRQTHWELPCRDPFEKRRHVTRRDHAPSFTSLSQGLIDG